MTQLPATIGGAVGGVIGAAVAGTVAGSAARWVLRRIPRGAAVPPPWCELAVATLWAAVAVACVAGLLAIPWVPVLLGMGWLAVAASAVDLAHRRLPNALTLPALPAVLLLVVPLGPATVLRAATGALLLVAVHAAVHLAAPRSLGAGDVKLSGPVGAALAAASWSALPVWAVLAALLTAGWAVWAALSGRSARGQPHGVSMLAAGWLVTAAAAGLGEAG
jgi:leader peptidase (prepilin peptidase)/N-methyltransferase